MLRLRLLSLLLLRLRLLSLLLLLRLHEPIVRLLQL
jgi:hypothetical protein